MADKHNISNFYCEKLQATLLLNLSGETRNTYDRSVILLGGKVLITGIGDRREGYTSLFTFEYKETYYIVYADPTDTESAMQCDSVRWNIWQGVHFSYDEVKNKIYDIADIIIDNSRCSPESYPMNGEHYVVDNPTKDDTNYQIVKETELWMFRSASVITTDIFKLVLTMMLAFVYTYVYINGSGISWASALFSMLARKQLVIILFVLEMFGSLVAFGFRINKLSFFDLFINTLIPLNIITTLAVTKTNPVIRIVLLCIYIVLSAIFFFPGLLKAFREKKAAKKRYKFKTAFKYSRIPLLISVFACIIAVNIFNISGYTYKSTPIEVKEPKKTINDNYYTACGNINENIWPKLTTEEKVDMLQAICDYKCINVLGCGTATVQTGYLSDNRILGEYNDTTNTITLNLDHLNDDHIEKVLDTLLHEIRHVWQHAVVDMYNDVEAEIDLKYLDLALFQQAIEFRSNFDDYKDRPSDKDDDYYGQAVETDSRQWAASELKYTLETYIYIDKIVDEFYSESE